MRILGAAAGLVLLAAASTVVLVVAVGVGLVWGVRRLLVGASDGAAPREQRAHDPQTLEGEFRVVTPESLEQSTRER
ncbi:MAG: hypothetical protein KDJ14_00470 [Xanthomonadales bacterium]|nr:hypothetical protein [Xanthomonadales bacterium]